MDYMHTHDLPPCVSHVMKIVPPTFLGRQSGLGGQKCTFWSGLATPSGTEMEAICELFFPIDFKGKDAHLRGGSAMIFAMILLEQITRLCHVSRLGCSDST